MAIAPSTPSSTKPVERRKPAPSAPSKTAPSAPSKPRPTSPKDTSDASKGATEARKAATERVKKDPVNNAIIGAVETVKTKASEIRATATEVKTNVEKAIGDADKAVRRAAENVKKDVTEAAVTVAKAAAPLVEPSIRETREAAREIGAAADKTSKSWDTLTNLDDHPEVQTVRDSNLDSVNKNILIAKEKLENGVQAGVDTLNNAVDVVDETLEGGVEILINNPVNTAVVEGGKQAVEGFKNVGSAIGGWFSDRVDGGERGAAKATKTVSETNSTIERRTKLQQAENDREIGAAAERLGDSWNNLDPSKHAEVEAVRNSDLDAVNKRILIAKETIENGIQNGVAVLSDLGNLGDEYIEAGVENLGTELQNAGDAISGGAKAVGGFVGGLFG